MSKSGSAIFRKRMVGFLWLAIICFLSLIPLFPVATLANLDAVSNIFSIHLLRRPISLLRLQQQDTFPSFKSGPISRLSLTLFSMVSCLRLSPDCSRFSCLKSCAGFPITWVPSVVHASIEPSSRDTLHSSLSAS